VDVLSRALNSPHAFHASLKLKFEHQRHCSRALLKSPKMPSSPWIPINASFSTIAVRSVTSTSEAWAAISESDQQRFNDECFAYDNVLRRNGPVGGEALQTVRKAKTLRLRNGKVMITDGPYAETKEQIGGFFSFEARDIEEAIRLVSNHPGLKAGPFEIRPVEDMSEVVRASERRRSQTIRT
jgi:hypothetical protein